MADVREGRRSSPEAGRPRARSASLAEAAVESALLKLDAASPVDRARILVDVALALRDDLGDGAQAADALLEALAADPLREEVVENLEPLLRAQGRLHEALDVAQRLAVASPDRARALAFAELAVRWYGELGHGDAARQWVERIRAIDSTHALVHMVEAALARERGDLKRELDELDFAVLSTRRRDDRLKIHLLMASRFLEERTLDLAKAQAHYEKAHAIDPGDPAPLRGLLHLAERRRDQVALASALRRTSEARLPADEKVTTLVLLARLEESEFKKPDAATRTLEAALGIDPTRDEAWDALERCLLASRDFPGLARALERAAGVATDPAVRRARLGRLAEVMAERLGDVRAAIDTWSRLATASPADVEIWTELARLTEKAGDVRAAVRARDVLASLATDGATCARHLVAAAQMLGPSAPDEARSRYERAMEADPRNAAAHKALVWDARSAGDQGRALRYLEERARGEEMPRTRASAFVELARARTRAGDEAGARVAWDEAWAADPENEAAASALAAAFAAEGQNDEALRACDVAVPAATRDLDVDRACALRLAEAVAAEALGDIARALGAAMTAYELKPSSPSVKDALAQAAGAAVSDPVLGGAREPIVRLADDADDLGRDALVTLGSVLRTLGEDARAAVLFDRVLEQDPADPLALEGLAAVQERAENPLASLALRRRLARTTADADMRARQLEEVAEGYVAARDEASAADVYQEARLARPRDLALCHKLVAIYQRLARWKEVYDTLGVIAQLDVDPHRVAKTWDAMARIAKNELADRATALACLDKVLDVDPSRLDAFERISRMLTEDRDWLGLESVYKKMLRRVDPGAPLRAALAKQLAVVYRDRLKNPVLALEALREVQEVAPNDDEALAMTRELLERRGDPAAALAVTLERVRREPLQPAPYPALFDLLLQNGDVDRALAAAGTMRFLGVPHAQAEALLTMHPAPPLERIQAGLGDEGVRQLLHEDLDRALTEIFEIVAPAAAALAVGRLPLRERLGHPGPSLKGHDAFARLVARAAQVLGAPAPSLHERRVFGPLLVAAKTAKPALLVSPAAATGLPAEVITFLVGKHVAELAPPLFARALFPSVSELTALAESAARIAMGRAEPGDAELAARLSRGQIVELGAVVERALSGSGRLDVPTWARLADVSASRAGLLLAGRLDAARAALATSPQAPGDPSPRDRMRELVAFWLGDRARDLRRRLG